MAGQPQADTPEVLDRFHAHLWLVEVLAGQLFRTVRGPIELDDLLSAGREGLLEAARRYRAAYGVPFRAYAKYRVHGAIVDQIRQLAPLPRRAYERLSMAEAAALVSEGEVEYALTEPLGTMNLPCAEGALEEHLAMIVMAAALGLKAAAAEASLPPTEQTPDSAYEQADLLARVRRELSGLSSDEQEIIQRYYFEDHRLEAIAEDLGLSKSWVSRLHTRAVARLAARLMPPGENAE